VIDSVELEVVAQEIGPKTVRELVLDLVAKASKTLRKMGGCGWDGSGCEPSANLLKAWCMKLFRFA
jgi:hypothetical protein